MGRMERRRIHSLKGKPPNKKSKKQKPHKIQIINHGKQIVIYTGKGPTILNVNNLGSTKYVIYGNLILILDPKIGLRRATEEEKIKFKAIIEITKKSGKEIKI